MAEAKSPTPTMKDWADYIQKQMCGIVESVALMLANDPESFQHYTNFILENRQGIYKSLANIEKQGLLNAVRDNPELLNTDLSLVDEN